MKVSILVALTLVSVGVLSVADGLSQRTKQLAAIRKLKQLLPRLNSKSSTDKLVDAMALIEQMNFPCEVSLPQKASLLCRAKRSILLKIKKKLWKLTNSSLGFMKLDRQPLQHLIFSVIKPFTRFNALGYVQMTIASQIVLGGFEGLINLVDPHFNPDQEFFFQAMSKYFELGSNIIGGEQTLRPSQFEMFLKDKDQWISDEFFTQQRLAGVNPMSLRRVNNSIGAAIGLDWAELSDLLNPTFDWDAAVQKILNTEESLQEVISQGRVYALRYELCDNLPRDPDITDFDPERTMWNTSSPIALFVSAEDFATGEKRLVPMAIQMDYTPESNVYTPEDQGNWMLAKLNVHVTDFGFSQMVEHLGKVHLLMEPFCVILIRTLAEEHPLHQMLKYHCRDITVPNALGTPALLNDGQAMDILFAFGNTGAVRLLEDTYELSTWEVTDFRGELRRRGLDDKEFLPYFPYRDDGEKIFQVIEHLVKDYVDLYYYRNRDVSRDYELQNYVNELSVDGTPSLGKIKGFPASIDTKEELCDIVTRIISQLVIQHTSVNYPLVDYGQYIPNLPTKLYNDSSLEPGEFDLSRLPNKNTTVFQSSLMNFLALYRFDTLFDYGTKLKDNRASRLLNNYFSHLVNVLQPEMQNINEERKENGYLTYPYMIPRWLPNGVQT